MPRATIHLKKKLILVAIAILLIVALVFACLVLFSPKNYAKETAEPIEAALVKAGAVKKCERGDSGRGVDNIEPWYGATFEISRSKSEAVLIAAQAASESGYKLTHASPTTRGPLDSVADAYIDDWYFDDTSKNSSYRELEQGKMKLSVVVYGEGQKNDCTQSVIQAGHSTIGIGLSLPYRK